MKLLCSLRLPTRKQQKPPFEEFMEKYNSSLEKIIEYLDHSLYNKPFPITEFKQEMDAIQIAFEKIKKSKDSQNPEMANLIHSQRLNLLSICNIYLGWSRHTYNVTTSVIIIKKCMQLFESGNLKDSFELAGFLYGYYSTLFSKSSDLNQANACWESVYCKIEGLLPKFTKISYILNFLKLCDDSHQSLETIIFEGIEIIENSLLTQGMNNT